MKFYFLPGLGADQRLFSGLDRLQPAQHPNYIAPEKGENLVHYSKRLQPAIGYTEDDVLIGFSFGGVCALEMSKYVEPKLVVLISSTRSYRGNTPAFKLQAKLLKLVPDLVLKTALKHLFPRAFNSDPMLSSDQEQLIKDMGRDLDISFFRWAAEACASWKGDFIKEKVQTSVLVVHGEKDQIIPKEDFDDVKVIKGGRHLIQYTHAEQVQKLVLEHL